MTSKHNMRVKIVIHLFITKCKKKDNIFNIFKKIFTIHILLLNIKKTFEYLNIEFEL